MASAQDLTTGGGGQTVSLLTLNVSSIISKNPGRLQKVLVTTTTAQVVTFYDNILGTAVGTIVGLVPSGTVAGTVLSFNMPTALGLSMVGAAGAGQITVSFN